MKVMDTTETNQQLENLKLDESGEPGGSAANAGPSAAQPEGQLLPGPSGLSSSSSALTNGEGSARPSVHCFHESTPEAVIHFQIISLGRQLYIWISVGSPKLDNLYFAIQSKVVGQMSAMQWLAAMGHCAYIFQLCPYCCA